MRVPLSWLHEYCDPGLSAEATADVVTMAGLEVEAVERPTGGARGITVVRVEDMAPVPGSDKLTLVHATDGTQTWEIVCGARNYAPGDLVPAALPGAVLPGGMEIGRRTLMGVTSNGMLCSPRELGVGDDHRGIWVLDADAPLGADVGEWLHLDDAVLVIELTPDRGYALSLAGIARDLAAMTGADLTLPAGAAPPAEHPGVDVTVADPAGCPRFTLRRISGVDAGRRSPTRVQHRLALAGMRPLSAVVDATNYGMLETGQPTHAFDLPTLGGAIHVRRARSGERLTTLDGVERTLSPEDLVVCDADRAVALAGIMGGADTEVTEATTEVALEAASWDPVAILRSGRRHGLRSEARTRFERTVHPEVTAAAADRVADLVAAFAGGTVSGSSDTYPSPPEPVRIRLRPARARSWLGVDLDGPAQVALLASIDVDVDADGDPAGAELTVAPPPWRPDLRIEADLYEELARLHGYDRIPQRVPSSGRSGSRPPDLQAVLAVRRALAGAGWTEALVFPFLSDEDLAALGLPDGDPRRTPLRLVNPLSKEEQVLRTTLVPGLLRVVRRNWNRNVAEVTVFETGRVFVAPTAEDPAPESRADGVALPAEPVVLGFAAAGAFDAARHDRPARPVDLADLAGAADVVRTTVGAQRLRLTPTAEMPYHPGRAARVAFDGVDVGVIGELHPRVAAAFEVPPRTLAGELRLDRIVAGGARSVPLRSPSALPGLRFDVAVIVAEATPHDRVADTVAAAAGPALSGLRLFDVYRGAQLGEGAKSLAFAVTLDDPDAQLTDADQAEAITAIAAAVERDLGGRLRR